MSIAEPQAAASDRDVVLAVDDNEQNLQLLQEYLWSWGYDVVLARDGAEAIALYPQHKPAIIVLDVMMPNVDGYQACARIKADPEGRRIPILMLTALTGTEDKIKALECGADDFLNKPINRDELRTRIKSLIRISNLRRELDSSESIILTLTTAIESKDPRSGGHLHRVASYAAKICDGLGMSQQEREMIVKGAMLHDVGNIGIPEELLEKKTHTDAERAILARHTIMGASILEPMRTFRAFLPIVRWHHERLDGSGYPDGLKGSQIPLEAQIVGIANQFDDVHHEQGLTEHEALASLEADAERGLFDRDLVRTLALALGGGDSQSIRDRHLAPRPRPHPRVLCVDDSKLNRDLITTTLSESGYDVVLAENGLDAMDLLEKQEFDVMLLDLAMPVQDGAETLRRVRSDGRYEFLPVVVLTSHRNTQMRQDAILAGADDFINYPLNRLELVTRIRSLLRMKDYHSDLEQTQNVICALALALEAKDHYTRGHSQRVGDLACTFAMHLGIAEETAERIRIAGLLHDIGKIAVPEALLNKRGPLTREEFLRVIDHPVIGEEMVRPLMTLTSVLQLIRHHHERYDGRGYPDGLRGDAIPYEVRLMSIVDAYDALTSHRAYRPAPLTHEAAIGTLQREAAGGKWDPDMVNAFSSMLGEEGPNWPAISRPVPTLRLE